MRLREGGFLDDEASPWRYLADLAQAQLIQRNENGAFVLVRDPATTTLYDLYAASTNYRVPLLARSQAHARGDCKCLGGRSGICCHGRGRR